MPSAVAYMFPAHRVPIALAMIVTAWAAGYFLVRLHVNTNEYTFIYIHRVLPLLGGSLRDTVEAKLVEKLSALPW